MPSVSNDVLWYHADYVSPGWGSRLTRVSQIGAHIFYSGTTMAQSLGRGDIRNLDLRQCPR